MTILTAYVAMILVAVMIAMGVAYFICNKIDENRAAREHAFDLERLIMAKRMEHENRMRLQDHEYQKKADIVDRIVKEYPNILVDMVKKMEDL